jgi:hypothetical protein
MKTRNVIIYIFLACLSFDGCIKEGPAGSKALLDMIVEPTGVNCSSGGFKVISGIDLNNNNILDPQEIQSTKYICNGNQGNNSLLKILQEPMGSNCAAGGYKIVSGVDENRNNILDTAEIQNTEYICNGDNGSNGLNGNSSLLNVIPELAGINCSSGGYKVVSGSDLNNNNILDDNEITSTHYICNGIDGAYDRQINLKVFDLITSPNGMPLTSIWDYGISYGGILKFNIDNYINIDSAILVAYDLTARDSYSGNKVSGTMKIELYDCKNKQVITNSEIISGEIPAGTYKYSKNFLKNLPHQDIDLGIKITKSSDFYAATLDIQLILYRK